MAESINITTPVARLIGGSLYTPRTTDYDGKPLVVKSGPNAGQPRVDFNFGVAIPKTPGVTHWANEPWGGPVWQLAHAAFPAGEAQRHDFAWKITDGDSQIPRKGRNGQPGRKPCEMEGWPGHWVMWFSGGYAPKIFNADGSQQILEPDAIKLGYYVQVFGNITDNKPSASPGLYINHTFVAFSAYGPEITIGPDVTAAGFGQGVTLPPTASAAPVAGAFNPAAPPVPPAVAPAPVPGLPPVATAPAPGMPPAYAPVSAPPSPPVAVQPYPAILNPGVPPVAPAPVPGLPPVMTAPPAPPVAPARVMLPAAQGATYETLIGAGWTDALLIAHGMMAP